MSNLKIMSMEQWIKLFMRKEYVNFSEFIELAKVKKSNGDLSPLSEYSKIKKIKKTDLKFIYNFAVVHKKVYLENFYKISLSIDSNFNLSHFCTMPEVYNNSVNKKSKNLIRNVFMKEILGNTGTIQPNIRTYMDVVNDLFNKLIIDYKILTPCILELIKKKKFGSILSGVYFRASIMSPFLVYNILRYNFENRKRVFSPTLGWGSYVTGLSQLKEVNEYVGVDVIPRVCKVTKQMMIKLNPKLIVDIYCEPSEGLIHNLSFLQKYKSHFDVIFFSPPYYEYELYEGNQQSTKQYKTYEEWLKKYWLSTIQLCHVVLKNTGKMCYIISQYKINNKIIDLPNDMNKITRLYFESIGKIGIENSNVGITNHRETGETAFLWSKRLKKKMDNKNE